MKDELAKKYDSLFERIDTRSPKKGWRKDFKYHFSEALKWITGGAIASAFFAINDETDIPGVTERPLEALLVVCIIAVFGLIIAFMLAALYFMIPELIRPDDY